MSNPLHRRHIEKRASPDALFSHFSTAADRLLLLCLLGAVCLFILYPMVCIFFRSLRGEDGLTFRYYLAVWKNYRSPLRNSLFVGVLTAFLCTVLSASAALAVTSAKGAWKALGMGLLLMSMVSPPFISSLAYIQLFGRRGWITYGLLGLRLNPYNCWGVILMQSISFVPMNALFLNGILSRLDARALQSARDLGAGPGTVLRSIVLPLIRPGIAVVALLSFIRSLADFGTPTIIGGRFSTIASEIYLQLIGYSDLEKSAAMNMFLLAPAIAAFFAYRWLLRRNDQLNRAAVSAAAGSLQLQLHRSGIVGWLAICCTVLFGSMMVLQYAVIFATGFLKTVKGKYHFTMEHFYKFLQYDTSTMIRSVEYALIVSVIGSLFAMLFAYYMERRKIRGRSFFDCLATLPYMIPGTCFGIGYILAFNHAPLKLTGTAVIVLANMLFKQLPTTTKICSAALTQVPMSLEYAARDLGGGQFAVLKDVILPSLRPAFFSCFSYNFSSSMTTAGAILFLINPGRKLAVFKLFDCVYIGEYASAALIASSIILIVVAVEGAVWLFDRQGGRNYVS